MRLFNIAATERAGLKCETLTGEKQQYIDINPKPNESAISSTFPGREELLKPMDIAVPQLIATRHAVPKNSAKYFLKLSINLSPKQKIPPHMVMIVAHIFFSNKINKIVIPRQTHERLSLTETV